MKMNKEIVGRLLLVISVLLIVGSILVLNTEYQNLKMAVRKSLHEQRSFEEDGINVVFTRGDDANCAIATSWIGSVTRYDVNKSKMVGEYIGSRTKEVAKGFVDGLKKSSKHGD